MKLSKQHIKTILDKLESVYPHMLESDGYRDLVANIGDDTTVDAHLLYLYEKGLINTDMRYDPEIPGWRVIAHQTRINSNGIDALANANP